VLDQTGDGLKLGIHELISRLLLMDTEMKLALSGVDLKEPVRVVFAFAPPDQPLMREYRAGGAIPPASGGGLFVMTVSVS
jgi:hypothetical protein